MTQNQHLYLFKSLLFSILVKTSIVTKLFEKPHIIFALNLLTILSPNNIAKEKITILPKIPPRYIEYPPAKH